MNKVELNKTVTVSASADHVQLSAIVGNQQLGTTVVKVDGNQIAMGTSITDLVLGSANDLNGKVVLVRTVINDVNQATSVTTMEYTINDDVKSQTFQATGEVDQSFGVIVYFANFTISAA